MEPLNRLKQLPTSMQVMQRFHLHLKETKLVRNASHLTIEELSGLWSNAAIPVTSNKHAIEKLEKLHNTWLLLKKNKGRSTDIQKMREIGYEKELRLLFDISHFDAMTLIKIPEDRDFLVDQRGDRKMFMATEDKDLVKKQKRAEERQRKFTELQHSARIASTSFAFEVCMTEESCESDSSDDSDDDFQPAQRKTPRSVEQHDVTTNARQLFTEHVTGALDRNQTSDREAVRLIVPVVVALGCSPLAMPLSRSSIRRARKKARKETAESLRAEFSPEHPLVVHWDGKILPEICGRGEVDRLPVLVSGDGIEKLLGVPKLATGTGENEAKAVYDLVEQWQLSAKVQAMSFDTTSVNTGRFSGVCVRLESMLNRELLWLACRHHVMELILAKVFKLCCGPSSAPFIPIFKRFKAAWDGVKRENYEGLVITSETSAFVESMKNFLNDVILQKLPIRDDYKELIELTMIVLGSPPAKIHWRAPGGIHHARWMAKLLYAMKIILFRSQRDVFILSKKEEIRLQRFVQFGALLYTKAWIEAPLAAEAPGQDMKLWIDLKKYQAIDSGISLAACHVLEHHLWYLSDELVGLALFSDRVSAAEKAQIVEGMTNEPGERKVRGDPTKLTTAANLGEFASHRTRCLLERLSIGESFLALSPDKWSEDESYRQGRERIKKLQVINDTAERGVKLFADFNHLLTNDEEEKQFLMQVVEENRKSIPAQTTKKSVVAVVCKM